MSIAASSKSISFERLLGFSDEALLEAVSEGNHDAFSVLVKRHTQKFFNLAWRYLKHGSDAEDLVQQAFIELWQRPDKFDASQNVKFTTWFYRVISNRCLDFHRSQSRAPKVVSIDSASEDNFEKPPHHATELEKQSQHDALEMLISDLPETQNMAMTLFYYEHVPQKEIADIMGLSLKAVESLISRAKVTLKKQAKQLKLMEEI